MTKPPTPFSYPMRTKIVVAVVIALAVGGFALAGLSTDTDISDEVAVSGGAAGSSDGNGGDAAGREVDGVVRVEPRDGAEALAQERISIRLAPGWTGELVLIPGSGSAVPLPADEVQVSALNELIYVPDEGLAVERLPAGRNCVRATIWDQVDGREATEKLHNWCFDVT